MVVLAIVLSGANLIGYIKCSKDAQKQMQNLASNALTTGITVRWVLVIPVHTTLFCPGCDPKPSRHCTFCMGLSVGEDVSMVNIL